MEFLTKLSQMYVGVMQIVIPKSLQETLGKDLGEKEIKLSELTKEQIKTLKDYQDQLEKKTTEELAQDMFTSQKNIELHTQQSALALTKYAKNITLGKNEDENSPLERLSKAQLKGRKLQADLMSNDPEFLKNMFEENFGTIMNGTTGLINVVKTGFSGFTTTAERLITTLEQYIKEKPNKENKQREKERGEWEEQTKVNDRRVTFNNNLKVTYLGLGDNITIDKTEKGFLTGYEDWG
jgi:hypothetical protein